MTNATVTVRPSENVETRGYIVETPVGTFHRETLEKALDLANAQARAWKTEVTVVE